MKKSKKKLMLYGVACVIAVSLIVLAAFFQYSQKSTMNIDDASQVRCQRQNASYLNLSLSARERADDLLSRMTDEDKIGQMTLIEKNSIHDVNDISRYHLGALLSGFGAKPDTNSPLGWMQMINQYQEQTKKTCLQIPLLYGVDAVHGFSNVIGATTFPHFIGLGATHDPDLVTKVAKATTEEMIATGIYWSFAPNVDVASDPRWGRFYETFGSDTATVSTLGSAYLQGIQSSGHPSLPAIGTLKHYIGNGSMEWGSSRNEKFKIDQGNVAQDERTLLAQHLPPFENAIRQGAQVVMVGLNSINGINIAANKHLITDILKTKLNFAGFVVSDWYGVYEISETSYSSTVHAINAGIDMVMLPYDHKKFKTDMTRALANGDITRDRMNDAVRRILTVKFNLGLFDRPAPTIEGLATVGSQAHRDIARQAVRESQVLLKNKNNVLPLSPKTQHILVAGSGADNLGRQNGAWTVEWQGIDGNWIPGTTILSGIKNDVSPNTKVDYNLAGDFPTTDKRADVGIAVVSEKPYAEGWGDDAHPQISADDLATINKLKAQSKKIIVIIISGRPLDIAPYIHDWDGVVASWLPGSEGQGVADVLFGAYPFTGTLPLKWDY